MSRTIDVPLKGHSYQIEVGGNDVFHDLSPLLSGLEVAVVTDEMVSQQLWFSPLQQQIAATASKYLQLTVPAGEASKSLEQFSSLCSALAAEAYSRRSIVVAVGGGVVGDLAGYLAASYLRGVRFIQIPTTLLSMVDSSVGGKTGVNLPEGKNLVGAFHQPESVRVNLELLETLPSREYSAGMAEVIKYGMIRDPDILDQVASGRAADMEGLVTRCVEIKRDVVLADEKETSGVRAILNFGHTIGHAIEQTAGYGIILHGEAISVGMVAACCLSEHMCGLSPEVKARLENILHSHDLPVRWEGLSFDSLKPVVARDKKSTGKSISWVLCPEPGQTRLSQEVTDEAIRAAIEYCSGAAA
ncbi:MAG: 3-dehydroquinate synthase [Verrucomicrobiota bacterium]